MQQIDYFGALRRSWRLLVALGILCAVIAVLIPASSPKKSKTATQLPSYPWRATAVVGASPSGLTSPLGGGVTNAQIMFYAGSSAVKQATLDAVGLEVSPAYASLILEAAPDGVLTKRGQQIVPVILVANATTSVEAVNLINNYADQLGEFLANLASQHQKGSSTTTVTPASIGYQVIQPAEVAPATKVAKKTGLAASRKVRALVGLAIGLLLAAAIVLARELLETRLRDAGIAESTFGYPVVAEIPRDPTATGTPDLDVEVVRDPGSAAAEAYRKLRMSVLFEALATRAARVVGAGHPLGYGIDPYANGKGSSPPVVASSETPPSPTTSPSPANEVGRRQVVLVVSAGSEATRPQVAANFAAVCAEAGERVVVMSTAELGAGLPGHPTGSLTGEVRPEDVEVRLERSVTESVLRLPLRDFIDTSGQLVTRAPAVIDAARGLADVIIVEAPPLLAVHHAEALSHAVDVVLVVGECGATSFDYARRAGDLLSRMAAPVLGVVLTNVRLDRRDIRQVHTATRPAHDVQSFANGDQTVVEEAGLSSAGAPATHYQA